MTGDCAAFFLEDRDDAGAVIILVDAVLRRLAARGQNIGKCALCLTAVAETGLSGLARVHGETPGADTLDRGPCPYGCGELYPEWARESQHGAGVHGIFQQFSRGPANRQNACRFKSMDAPDAWLCVNEPN